MSIRENVRELLAELPAGVALVAAAKTRTPEEVLEAIEAGIGIVGENYVQEAQAAYDAVGGRAAWHFIGHLQKNKVKKAVAIFDMIETVDSLEMAAEIDRRCAEIDKTMPVLIEVNSGREPQKSGVYPEDAATLIAEISKLENVRAMGMMTMGPLFGDPEDARPCFAATRQTFEGIAKLEIPRVEMRYLSMGMTDTYRIAVAEGANIVRIGSRIFGARPG